MEAKTPKKGLDETKPYAHQQQQNQCNLCCSWVVPEGWGFFQKTLLAGADLKVG